MWTGQADDIGARLMSLCHKFQCSEELAERLVDYGHHGRTSTWGEVVWSNGFGFPEDFPRFTWLKVLPIVPEEFIIQAVLPVLGGAASTVCYARMLTTVCGSGQKISTFFY